MDHRKVLRTQIDIGQGLALTSVGLLVIGPELLIFLLGPRLFPAALSDNVPLLIVMGIALFPFGLLGAMVYHRLMLTAALYATLLNIDENLEKLVKKAG